MSMLIILLIYDYMSDFPEISLFTIGLKSSSQPNPLYKWEFWNECGLQHKKSWNEPNLKWFEFFVSWKPMHILKYGKSSKPSSLQKQHSHLLIIHECKSMWYVDKIIYMCDLMCEQFSADIFHTKDMVFRVMFPTKKKWFKNETI